MQTVQIFTKWSIFLCYSNEWIGCTETGDELRYQSPAEWPRPRRAISFIMLASANNNTAASLVRIVIVCGCFRQFLAMGKFECLSVNLANRTNYSICPYLLFWIFLGGRDLHSTTLIVPFFHFSLKQCYFFSLHAKLN